MGKLLTFIFWKTLQKKLGFTFANGEKNPNTLQIEYYLSSIIILTQSTNYIFILGTNYMTFFKNKLINMCKKINEKV